MFFNTSVACNGLNLKHFNIYSNAKQFYLLMESTASDIRVNKLSPNQCLLYPDSL